jgi:hypothetical protein
VWKWAIKRGSIKFGRMMKGVSFIVFIRFLMMPKWGSDFCEIWELRDLMWTAKNMATKLK